LRHKTGSPALAILLCFLACLGVMAGAVAYFYKTGAILYSGDAEAHLDIARRILDSRTPGWDQVGTAWLPLPHLLMIPLVRYDWLWRTGLAGGITSGIAMALAATFLFAAVRRIFGTALAASTAAAVFLLNPNTLYLGSIPMTEPVFFASLFAVLFFTVRFGETRGWGALTGAAIAACAGTWTRYEAWFLLPFVALYIWRKSRWPQALVFCLIAAAGPLAWFWHNRWYFGDPLYFYRGPWSALAIQGTAAYPGKGDWRIAAQYFFAAGRLVAGLPGLALAAAGGVAALSQRVVWPLVLLLLPPAFYVWSIHSSGTPIYVPSLEPHSWYNIRYAMAFLPLVALGGAALARFGRPVAAAAVLVSLAPFLLHPGEHAITWQEAEVNSRGARDRTAQAVDFLHGAMGPRETFVTSFGALTPIYRTLGVPLRDTLTGDNGPLYLGAWSRPDLFLREDWAIVTGGDEVQGVIDKAGLRGPHFDLSRRIIVKGQPVVEIYHRE